MKGLMLIVGWLVIAVPVAAADCGATDKTLFSCLTTNAKQIEVCNFGKTIRYSFGKPRARAAISVSVPRDTVDAMEDYGGGRSITHTVDIGNGNTIYRVGWSDDRLSDSTRGWVEVIINGKSKSVVSCASEPIIGDLVGIKFKAPAFGE